MTRLLVFLLLALPLSAERLYVTNERAGTIQVIDTATDKVVAAARIGNRPRGLALSPDGRRLYVAVSWWRDGKRPRTGREAIVAVDTKTLRIERQFEAGTDPECVAVSPDGQRLYLSNEDAATASIVDVESGKQRATLVVGVEPEGVTASPDGRWVYVTGETSNTLTVIDAKTEKVATNILVDARPRAVIFSPDGKKAWSTAELGGSVLAIDVSKHRPVKRIRLAANHKPVGLVLTPDGKRLYVATGRGNSVAVIDTATNKHVATIPTGERTWGIAMTSDGKKLYAANSLGNTISVIVGDRVVGTIGTDDGPWGVVVGP